MEQLLSLHHVAVPGQSDPEFESALGAWMGADRRQRVSRFRRAEDRRARWLAAGLFRAAALEIGIDFRPDDILQPDHGAPRWIGGPFCSLAHTDGAVVLLVASAGPVGVDIESSGAVRTDDMRLLLPATLRPPLDSADLTPTAAWVRIEAVLKAAGVGLPGVADLVFDGVNLARWVDREFALRSISLADEWTCCCAIPRDCADLPLRVVRHTADSLRGLLALA